MSKFLLLFSAVFALILGFNAHGEEAEEMDRAEAETIKIQEVVRVYNEAMRTDLVPSEVQVWNIGTILENGHTVSIYSCTPNLLQGIAGPTGSLFHVTSASLLISYDPEASVPAQVYRTSIVDAKYVAFGTEETLKNKKGYRQVLKDAFVMPVSGQENTNLIAKIIHLNGTNLNMPITLDYQGEIIKGPAGQNLPWRNWRVVRTHPTTDTNLMDLESGIKKLSNMKGNIPLGVRIQKTPIALLDAFGRVIVGRFNFGEIEDPGASQIQIWKDRVENRAQAMWASKLISSLQLQESEKAHKAILSSENLSEQKSVLKFDWNSHDWPEKLPRPQSEMPIFLIQSSTSGRTSGEYRNPNYKFMLKFTDVDEQLQFQLNFQNNIRDIVGRVLPFGNRTESGLFTNSDGAYSDVVNLQLGFDGVSIEDGSHHIDYGFKRQIPEGSLMVHELELTPTGEVGHLRATLQFRMDRWADVHPAGQAVAEINFTLPDFKRIARPVDESKSSKDLLASSNQVRCEFVLR